MQLPWPQWAELKQEREYGALLHKVITFFVSVALYMHVYKYMYVNE